MERYENAIRFVEMNRRKPSRYIPEERNLRPWWKNTRKRKNAGEVKPDRVEMFNKLHALAEENMHVNQYL